MDKHRLPKREPKNEPMLCMKCGVMCSCPDAYRAHIPVCRNRNIVTFASHNLRGEGLSGLALSGEMPAVTTEAP